GGRMARGVARPRPGRRAGHDLQWPPCRPSPAGIRAAMPELALQLLLLLFLAGLLAGFIDSIAGGGGMVTIPAMLLVGIPPLQTLGTNKLQSLFGAGSASWAYARHGHVDLRSQLPMALAAAAGAVAGALLATVVPGAWLRAALPLLLVGIALYFALKPDIGAVERQQR